MRNTLVKHNVEAAQKKAFFNKKSNAKRKGIPFELEFDDIEFPKECPVLGIPIQYLFGYGVQPNSPSFDRVNPTKGYVKGNVHVISNLANTMKSYATPEMLVRFAEWVLKNYGDQ